MSDNCVRVREPLSQWVQLQPRPKGRAQAGFGIPLGSVEKSKRMTEVGQGLRSVENQPQHPAFIEHFCSREVTRALNFARTQDTEETLGNHLLVLEPTAARASNRTASRSRFRSIWAFFSRSSSSSHISISSSTWATM